MSLRAVEMYLQAELVAGRAHVFQSFLVVRACSADPDVDLCSEKLVSVLLHGFLDTSEGRRHVGEIRDTSSNNKDLPLRILLG